MVFTFILRSGRKESKVPQAELGSRLRESSAVEGKVDA